MKHAALTLSSFLLLAPAVAHAETYWVSSDGTAAWASCAGTTPLDGTAACAVATANANAQAGDTVYLRAGTYTGEIIEPANSGTDDSARIVFAAHAGEDVVIRDSAYGIYLYKQSYITVDGISFVSLRRFFRIYAGHYNTISYCSFDERSTDSGDWAGAIIADDFADDTPASEDSTHNWVHHCSFFRWAYGAYDEYRGALLNLGSDQSAGDDSSYNLIEHNTFAYGGHHTLGVYSQYNVIRYNYIHNETNAAGWDFAGYRGAITEGPSAGRCLYEGNRFGFSDASGMALRSPHNIYRRNLFYENGSGGLQVVSSNAGIDHADYNHIYHNTFYRNGHLATDPGFQGGMHFANWSGASPVGNVVKNNIFHDSRNGSVTYEGAVDPQTVESNWDEEGDPLFTDVTTAVDPMDHPPSLPDFYLLEQSPCIDRGGYVTTITSADGTGTTFDVDDAGYFMDGWGIVDADLIQLEGQSETTRITQVDYDTNTITVDGALSWTQGQGVNLAYVDAAPDLGAYEFGAADACADQAGACCDVGQQCTGGQFMASADCGTRCCVGGTCEAGTGGSGGGSGGAGGQAGSPPGASPADSADDGGCGCRLAAPATPRGGSTGLAWLLAVTLLGGRRRRRAGWHG